MGVIENIKRFFKSEPPKDPTETTSFTKIENLEQAANYLQAIKDQAAIGDNKIDVEITTATSGERRKYLNYAISLLPAKLMKYKILLFLRINPIYENKAQGREIYLSKKEIARVLSQKTGREVLEGEVDNEEQKGIRYCMEMISNSREKLIPLFGGQN